MPPIALVGLGIVIVAFVGAMIAGGGVAAKAVAIPPLTRDMVASALKWGRVYDIPASWITATMIVESGGNPRTVGDQGRSIGLMQVNAGANTATLQALGVDASQLYDIDTNIRVGTALMRKFLNSLLAALGGRTPPLPLDVLLRLYYRGPALVTSAIKAGKNPIQVFDEAGFQGTASASNWRAALSKTSAVV